MNSLSTRFDQIDQQKQQQNTSQKQENSKKHLNGEKPIWNYQNMVGRKALPNTMKDPFYSERAKFIEERKRKRQEYFNSLHLKNTKNSDGTNIIDNKKHINNGSKDRRSITDLNLNSSIKNQPFQPKESIMKLITKNLASNPIYEEEEDNFINNNVENPEGNAKNEINENINLSNVYNSNSSSLEDLLLSNRGYVPFMRTNEILDPVHAASPIPPSRESSAIKRSRDKARKVRYSYILGWQESFDNFYKSKIFLCFCYVEPIAKMHISKIDSVDSFYIGLIAA